MSDNKKQHCYNCEDGYYKEMTGPGRKYCLLKGVYLETPSHITTIECECGSSLSTVEECEEICDILYKELALMIKNYVKDIIIKHNSPQEEIERGLRVNPLLFPKMISGEKLPTGQIIGMLDLFLNVPGAFEHLRFNNE